MPTYGILVNYEYCDGCQSCEVSCKNEKMLDKDPLGVKVLQHGPYQLDEKTWEWDYFPVFTKKCDLCAERVKRGEKPACVLHCLSQCLTYGPVEELAKTMSEKGKYMYIFRP